jgi:Zn-finger nucleic acid-binding protein
MNCPNCAAEMTPMTLDGHQGRPVSIDLCVQCQAFWFDKFESLQLAPASTLRLLKIIGEQTSPGPTQFADPRCPRCSSVLKLIQDMQRTTRFSYYRCASDHGRFIRFFEFLREKDFIRPVTPQQLEELRHEVQIVNCSNCGAPIDLSAASACAHCKSPVSILDMKQPEALLAQLRKASEPRPIDPALPLELARAKRDVEALFAEERKSIWLKDAPSDIVHTCLNVVARWLTNSGM